MILTARGGVMLLFLVLRVATGFLLARRRGHFRGPASDATAPSRLSSHARDRSAAILPRGRRKLRYAGSLPNSTAVRHGLFMDSAARRLP